MVNFIQISIVHDRTLSQTEEDFSILHSIIFWKLRTRAIMDTPQYINEGISDVRCIKPGWYAMDDVGNLSSGPFCSHAECFESIIQPADEPLQNPHKQKECHDKHHDETRED